MKKDSNKNKIKANVFHKVSTKSQTPVIYLEIHAATEMHLMKSLKSINKAEYILHVVNQNKCFLKSTMMKN